MLIICNSSERFPMSDTLSILERSVITGSLITSLFKFASKFSNIHEWFRRLKELKKDSVQIKHFVGVLDLSK